MENRTVDKVREDFINCGKVLAAIGDETRQHIILALMEAPCNVGMRVGEITSRTHLSRPAVSHHLKVLKDANVVSMRKEGTMNFYYINVLGGFFDITKLSDHIKDYVSNLQIEQKEKK